jgi:hypothetical protein
MRACARCGQEFNPAPIAGTIDWPQTDCNFCQSLFLSPSAFRVLYALDWLAINRGHSRIDSKTIALSIGKGHSIVIRALKELAKSGIIARQLPQKDATFCTRCSRQFDPTPKRSGVGRPRTQCNDCRSNFNERNIPLTKRARHGRNGRLPSRAKVIERWGNRCHLCEKTIDLLLPGNDRRGFTFDHVIPVSKGGTDDLHNIRPAHWICNIRRGNRGPVQLDLGMCG